MSDSKSKKSGSATLTRRDAFTVRDTDKRTVIFDEPFECGGKTIPAGVTRSFWRWGDVMLHNDGGSDTEPCIVDMSHLAGHIQSGGAHYAEGSKRF